MGLDDAIIDGRGLFLPGSGTLVVADLHLGKTERRDRDYPVPDYDGIDRRFRALLDRHSPSTVVFNGDTFHHVIPTDEAQSRLADLLDELDNRGIRAVLVVGNHEEDADNLSKFVDGGEVTNEFECDDVVICHGHANPSEHAKTYVVGHAHPVVDGRHAYVHARVDDYDAVVQPAFTDFIDGDDPSRPGFTEAIPLLSEAWERRAVPEPQSPTQLSALFPGVGDDPR